ncbi:hypothetical protein GLYMA_13G159626v4 [Glycine max]|nr:hypothetical protein GLYMA_13G159626v4 [Glycine max]KAH1101782.1 hypothetical protein GYH30_036385 [Glycine max]
MVEWSTRNFVWAWLFLTSHPPLLSYAKSSFPYISTLNPFFSL